MADELYDSQYNNDEIWGLNYEEIGEVMCRERRIPASTDPIMLKIRTILPQQLDEYPELYPRDWGEILLDMVYCNDTPCRPNVSPSIGKRNYIIVPRNANSEFLHYWLDRGAKLKVELRNEDIDDMHISNNMDPSYCDSCMSEHPLCTTRYRCGSV